MTRRSLLTTAGASVAGMWLAEHSLAGSFASLEQIDVGLLNVGYADVGRSGGVPVVLLHVWWPYDIPTFVEAAELLLSEPGTSTVVPGSASARVTRDTSRT